MYIDVGMCVFFSLELGTVESQCSEGGIRDVTAARHTEDLQLVASSAETDQAFICYLLEATEDNTKQLNKTQRHTDTSLMHCYQSLPPPIPQPNVRLTVQDCILMVVSSGQCF